MRLRNRMLAACRPAALALLLAAYAAPAAVAQPAARPPDDAAGSAGARAGEGRPQPRHPTHHQDAAVEGLGCAAEPEAGLGRMGARLLPLARSIGAIAGVGRRRGACGHGGLLHRAHRALVGVRRAGRRVHRRPRTSRTSTSGPRACRRTSAPRPAPCGTAASTGPRWRCCIAGCCRASRTSISCRYGIRAPRATAWHCRRASAALAVTTPRV